VAGLAGVLKRDYKCRHGDAEALVAAGLVERGKDGLRVGA
jgi:hypothetical protein